MVEFILMLLSFFGLVGFIFAGIEDLKTRRVSTLISSSLWILLFVTGSGYSRMYYIAIGVFAMTFFVNSFNAIYRRSPLLGMGDVFLFPIFCAFVIQMLPNYIVAFIIIGLAMFAYVIRFVIDYIVTYRRLPEVYQILKLKLDAPLVSYMAVFYLVAFLVALL